MDRIFADREPMPLPEDPPPSDPLPEELSPAGVPPVVSVVVPTVGRPSLAVLLNALAADPPIRMGWELLLVDDRRAASTPLAVPAALTPYTRILTGHAAGPAAARNTGWRAARAPWIVFLDDDVRPEPAWWRRLPADLAVPADVGGVQGQLAVPMPGHRRPTDWERTTGGLGNGLWITADMAYRRAALAAVGGFDERFPRAFREDSELAHRIRLGGWRLVRGERRVIHPVRPEGPWVSLRAQRGNADDALLRRMYGPGWRDLLGVPRGRRRSHVATTAAGALALLGAAAIAARHSSVSARSRGVDVGVARGRGTGVDVARVLSAAVGVARRRGPGVGVARGRGTGVDVARVLTVGVARGRGAGVGVTHGRSTGVGVTHSRRAGLSGGGSDPSVPVRLGVTAGRRGGVARGRRVSLWGGVRGLTWMAAAAWLAGTAEFAAARIRPGPRRPAEVATMVATSALIPPVATLHWLRGWIRGRGAHPLATCSAPADAPPITETRLPAGAVGPP
jgi:hypothetical protein